MEYMYQLIPIDAPLTEVQVLICIHNLLMLMFYTYLFEIMKHVVMRVLRKGYMPKGYLGKRG